jgi:hypothetical protein
LDSLLEEGDEVGLGRLLESHDGRGLEAEVRLEVLSDLTDETLEAEGGGSRQDAITTKGRLRCDARELADEELSRLLVTPDLTKSDRSRSVPVRLLDTTSGGGRLPRGLGCELLAGGLSSGRLSCGLLQALAVSTSDRVVPARRWHETHLGSCHV